MPEIRRGQNAAASAQEGSLWFPAPPWRQRLRRRLLAWYARCARQLPWRDEPTPYRVWISEVMLQQTQVQTVVPYFERFVAALPSVHHLAAAEEEEVLRLWQGLGYYRRGRQLHQAAREIVRRWGGEFPQTLQQWLSLPGVGRYTAGAVLSIALGKRVPILEANTKRLLARLAAYQQPVEGAAGQRYLWQLAQVLLPRKAPGTFNQAMMELGSLVCRPQSPQCAQCPVEALCRARELGLEQQLPRSNARPRWEQRHEVVLALRSRGQVLLQQRERGEWWAGLWDLPRKQIASARAESAQVAGWARELLGVAGFVPRRCFTAQYTVTRFRVRQQVFQAEVANRRAKLPEGARWFPIRRLDQVPLPSPTQKVLRRLGWWE